MSETAHPPFYCGLRDVFGRVPFVRCFVAIEDDAIVQIVLEYVFRQALGYVITRHLPARVVKSARSCRWAFPVRINVIEILPVEHIFAVNTRNFEKAFVHFQRTQFLGSSLVIDKFMNAEFEIEGIDMRLGLREGDD